MSSDVLNLINKSQDQQLFINKKYLNYILYSNIEKIEELTGLRFTNYNDNYLDSKIKNIKKIPDIFLIHEFFLSLYIAIAIEYQNYEFYFITKLDERGRKYDLGYPLNFQRDKIFRNLFLLDKEKVLNDINQPFYNRSKIYNIYKEYLNKIESKEKEFNLFNILQNPIECIIGFDATSQIFQIIGGLLRDKKMLNLSNVINLYDNNKKNDIYSYFLTKLQSNLSDNTIFNDKLKLLNNLTNNISSVKKIKGILTLNYI